MGSEFEQIKGLSAPARRALANAGIRRLGDLRRVAKAEVAALHGMGPKGIRVLTEALAERSWEWPAQ